MGVDEKEGPGGSHKFGEAAQSSVAAVEVANRHAAPAVHSLQSLDVSEHWAIPQRWGCSPSSKLYSSAVLVTVLGAASAVATYYTIVQSVDMDWDCAAVHSR